MNFYQTITSLTNQAAGVPHNGVMLIDAVLIVFLVFCAITDFKTGKVLNKATFPAMLLGLALNGTFGGLKGLVWSAIGLCFGIAIQWVPFMLNFAKAGDVKLLGAVGALKGWYFCFFGFLYGAIAFLITIPFLLKKQEQLSAAANIKAYAEVAILTQSAPEAPTPTVTRRYLPWAVGLCVGFIIALLVELCIGRAFWK